MLGQRRCASTSRTSSVSSTLRSTCATSSACTVPVVVPALERARPTPRRRRPDRAAGRRRAVAQHGLIGNVRRFRIPHLIAVPFDDRSQPSNHSAAAAPSFGVRQIFDLQAGLAVVADLVGVARRAVRGAARGAPPRRSGCAPRRSASTSRSATADRSSTSRASGSAASMRRHRGRRRARPARRNARRLTSSANSSSISHWAIDVPVLQRAARSPRTRRSRARAGASARPGLHHRAALRAARRSPPGR